MFRLRAAARTFELSARATRSSYQTSSVNNCYCCCHSNTQLNVRHLTDQLVHDSASCDGSLAFWSICDFTRDQPISANRPLLQHHHSSTNLTSDRCAYVSQKAAEKCTYTQHRSRPTAKVAATTTPRIRRQQWPSLLLRLHRRMVRGRGRLEACRTATTTSSSYRRTRLARVSFTCRAYNHIATLSSQA